MEHGVQTPKFSHWLVMTGLCDLGQFPHLSNENVDLGFLLVLILCDSFWDHGRIHLHSLNPLIGCLLSAQCSVDVRDTM